MNDFVAGDLCSFEGCHRDPHARGLCAGHYAQARRGEALRTLRAKRTSADDPAQHFWTRVNKTDECWLWNGATDGGSGYGVVHYDGRNQRAHRVAFELTAGPLGDLIVDHVCHNPLCVRPDHLRAVDSKQNVENVGISPRNTSGYKGVTRFRDGRRWLAQVTHHGRKQHIGIFDTPEEAAAAARRRRNELFTHNDADRLVS